MTTVYADNAATTQMSRAAIDAMLPYLETCLLYTSRCV